MFGGRTQYKLIYRAGPGQQAEISKESIWYVQIQLKLKGKYTTTTSELHYILLLKGMMSDQQYQYSITEELNARAAGKNKLETTTKRNSSKCRNKKSSSKLNTNENAEAMEEDAEEEGCSGVKKLDHNAKERIRRMKLKESYHALRALLPDSKRSKKKWSAPAIVDRVLKYIPELEKEIEELRCNKENHVQYSQPKEIISCTRTRAKYEIPTISLSQVNQQEAIFQVCMARDKDDDDSQFVKVLQNVEEEGICIKNASALQISDRICHHLHIQIQTKNSASEAERQFEELRDKLISWLR